MPATPATQAPGTSPFSFARPALFNNRVHPVPATAPAPVEAPPSATPSTTPPAARPGPQRRVQVSQLGPYDSAIGFRRLAGLGLASGLAGATALGTWIASSVAATGGPDEEIAQGTAGAAAALGGWFLGTLIPLAAAKAWQWGQLRAERARMRDSDLSAQLDRLVEQALQRAPLTDAGLATALADIQELTYRSALALAEPEYPPDTCLSWQQTTQAVARLAEVALRPAPCRNPREQVGTQLAILTEYLLRQHGRFGISTELLREALLTMSDALTRDGIPRGIATEGRTLLQAAFGQATKHHDPVDRRQLRATFLRQLDERMTRRAAPDLDSLPVVAEEVAAPAAASASAPASASPSR